MGQEQSTYEGRPEILEARDLPSVAKYMKSDRCKKIFVMLGAGVSTSAGIPDFRSPDTGIYANLARLNLPYPEAVFEINFFRENPVPFYALARELLPGKFRPTLTHSFVRVLADHKLLATCFTQNIDTLERLAGVPPDKVIEAHGSFANQHCIECKKYYDGARLREHIKHGTVATCDECDGLVKPDIVFFGEALPLEFQYAVPALRSADLLFVMGTSLTVHPFASLASIVPDTCPRVLFNIDQVGDFGSRSDDVICLGKTDDLVRDLCRELGDVWEGDLDAAWKATEGLIARFEHLDEEAEKVETAEEHVKSAVEKMTSDVEKSLQIGEVPAEETKADEGPKMAEGEQIEEEVEEWREEVELELQITESTGTRADESEQDNPKVAEPISSTGKAAEPESLTKGPAEVKTDIAKDTDIQDKHIDGEASENGPAEGKL